MVELLYRTLRTANNNMQLVTPQKIVKDSEHIHAEYTM